MRKNKVLVLIPNYGSENKPYLRKMLEGLNQIQSTDFEIHLFSTQYNDDLCDLIYKEWVSPESIGKNLTLEPYRFLATHNLDHITHILYTENDLLFTEHNFLSWFKCSNNIPTQSVPGFIRYEIKDQDQYLIDANNDHNPSIIYLGSNLIYQRDEHYMCPMNVHSGCWMLKTEDVLNLLDNPDFLSGTTLEDRASNVYFGPWPGSSVGYNKYIPIKNFTDFLIHHQPNKYIHLNSNSPTVDSYLDQFRKYAASH